MSKPQNFAKIIGPIYVNEIFFMGKVIDSRNYILVYNKISDQLIKYTFTNDDNIITKMIVRQINFKGIFVILK